MKLFLTCVLCLIGLCVATSPLDAFSKKAEIEIEWYTDKSGSFTVPGGNEGTVMFICPGTKSVAVTFTPISTGDDDNYVITLGEVTGVDVDAKTVSEDTELMYNMSSDEVSGREMEFGLDDKDNCLMVVFTSQADLSLSVEYGNGSTTHIFRNLMVVFVILLVAAMGVVYAQLDKAKKQHQPNKLAETETNKVPAV
ncbi:hypothetical protein KIPB_000352 [Kipferlia bialata]|uniref:Uncharacterized protein n=1 Tax=Kipferlia bialata TaxID=797122 RepID=A0A391NI22_9EUKA|nr:hypothetical protein KIPB_000352 [Kipferlia bialata]|eukprot:g352.t1